MDSKIDIESMYKELVELNQRNKDSNLKAAVQLEEVEKRLKNLLNSADEDIKIDIDFSRLNEKSYIAELSSEINQTIINLEKEFELEVSEAKKELSK